MPGHKYQRGHKKMGGRKKGVPNKKTVEIAQFSRQLFSEVFKDPQFKETIKRQIASGKNSAVALELLKYGYGKPPEKIILEGDLAVTHNADAVVDKLIGRLARLAPKSDAQAGTEQAQSAGTTEPGA